MVLDLFFVISLSDQAILHISAFFPAHRDKGAKIIPVVLWWRVGLISKFKNLLGFNLTERYRAKRKTRRVVKDGVVCLRAGGG